jgi:hypothetical protein
VADGAIFATRDRSDTHSPQVSNNNLKWLPAELGQLTSLTSLWVRARLVVLHQARHLLSPQLARNLLPPIAGLPFEDTPINAGLCACWTKEIVSAATHIGFIRERATEICIGLQDIELPAFVTLAIIDEAVHENTIRMWAKWELITAVKHYRDRRYV